MSVQRRAPLIVVADDEHVIRELVGRRLQQAGYEVQVAEDGVDALGIFEREEFVNVLLTDLRMPQMDGVELLKRVKTRSPDTEVIIMTAYASTDTAIDAVRLGAFDYLQKPFEHVDDVAHKVKMALRQQSLEFQNREMLRKLEELNKGLKNVVLTRTKELNATQERLRAMNRRLRDLIRGREEAIGAINADVRRSLEEIQRLAEKVESETAGGRTGAAADAAAAIRREAARCLDVIARVSDPVFVPAADDLGDD